ncbi:Magnesium transporter MRS2-I [Acorus calamus]|uniref:Magnesium transporter MRS2-I n=1 Tax=Acorus calamus TaxID=4465 RepID=A0AAV9CEQ3_ACOCL|nr:Magnesium transporter MRS2-I [Acorus calamus]
MGQHIKAIITAKEVLLRDPLDDNVIPIVEELRRRLPPVNEIPHGKDEGGEQLSMQHDVEVGEEDESPFEFRALEVALEAICSFLDARTTELETGAYPALDELTSKVRDELEQLLDDDDDMADLYLSRKLVGASSPVSGSGAPNWFPVSPTIGSKISRVSRASALTNHGNENDVEELEMLLEAYFMQIDGTLNRLTTLDNHRNQLIQLELFLSSGTVCLSFYALIAGIFGMNIPFSWKDDHGYVYKWALGRASHNGVVPHHTSSQKLTFVSSTTNQAIVLENSSPRLNMPLLFESSCEMASGGVLMDLRCANRDTFHIVSQILSDPDPVGSKKNLQLWQPKTSGFVTRDLL